MPCNCILCIGKFKAILQPHTERLWFSSARARTASSHNFCAQLFPENSAALQRSHLSTRSHRISSNATNKSWNLVCQKSPFLPILSCNIDSSRAASSKRVMQIDEEIPELYWSISYFIWVKFISTLLAPVLVAQSKFLRRIFTFIAKHFKSIHYSWWGRIRPAYIHFYFDP